MMRDQIAQAMMMRQQQKPGALGSPFAPAPVPQQQPMFAGTPNLPIAAQTPQYGFETGYRAAAGPAIAGNDSGERLKALMQWMTGTPGTTGSSAP